MNFGGSRTGADSSINSGRGAKSETKAHSRADFKDFGTGAQSEIGNNSVLNLEGRVGSDADSKTESKVWKTGADSEPVAVKAGCLVMASVSSMDETMTADCLRVAALAITGSTSSSEMISFGIVRLAGLDSVGMTRLAKTSSVGTQTGASSGADSMGSRTGAGSVGFRTGAGSVGSRTGAGSVGSRIGRNSVGSRTGAGSVGSRTRAGSGVASVGYRTGAATVGYRTGAASGANSVGSRTEAASGADSVGSRTGAASGADSVGSRTGAASGADSVGSRTRAASGADPVGSRTGAASRTGADSVGSRTGADSGAAELLSGAAGKTVDSKTQPFFLLCLRGCSGMNTGPRANTAEDSEAGTELTISRRIGADLTGSGLTDSTDSGVTVAFSTSSGKSGVDLPTSAVTAVDSADTVMATAFRTALILLNQHFNVGGI